MNPNDSWHIWESFFQEALDKHAPLIHKSLRQNSVPWINSKVKKLIRSNDTQIYASSASFSELILKLNQDLENIVKWLSHNKLQLHTKKTKAMFIGSPYNLRNKVGNEQVMINDKPVTCYSSFRCLGCRT